MLHEQGATQDDLHVSYRRDRGASLEHTCTQRGVDQTHAARWPHGRGFAQLALAATRTETSLLRKAPPDSNSMREEEEGGDEPDSGCVAGSAGSALYPLGSRRAAQIGCLPAPCPSSLAGRRLRRAAQCAAARSAGGKAESPPTPRPSTRGAPSRLRRSGTLPGWTPACRGGLLRRDALGA